MISNYTIAILIFFATYAGKLIFDTRQHFSGKTISHTGEGAIAVIVLVVASFFATSFRLEWITIAYLAEMLMVFWALTDMGMGILIASNPWYLGTTSKLDRAQKANPALVYFKYIGAALSILFFIFKNHRP